MFQLNRLTSIVKKKKRIGRGGSRGGTSGKGHKGQKARAGHNVRMAFEGGQMPLHRRLPKRGFNNHDFKKEVQIVSLDRIAKKFDNDAVVTIELLIENDLVTMKKSAKGAQRPLVKILGNDAFSKRLTIIADAFSQSALQAIKDCGGEARLVKEI